MSTFFDENGLLDIDGAVTETATFKKIMEDGIVTQEEVISQAELVNDKLHILEENLSQEQASMVRELMAQMSVLYTVYHIMELQALK